MDILTAGHVTAHQRHVHAGERVALGRTSRGTWNTKEQAYRDFQPKKTCVVIAVAATLGCGGVAGGQPGASAAS